MTNRGASAANIASCGNITLAELNASAPGRSPQPRPLCAELPCISPVDGDQYALEPAQYQLTGWSL
jgi:hypothetical protein